MSLVLGIDPGSRVTGYGLIDIQGNRLSYVDCGCIRTEGGALPARLKKIFDGVVQLVETHQPSQVAIEEVFVGKNAASALKLGQARGAAMAACLQFKLEVSEYSARQVKQAVVGTGAAQKAQVQQRADQYQCTLHQVVQQRALQHQQKRPQAYQQGTWQYH